MTRQAGWLAEIDVARQVRSTQHRVAVPQVGGHDHDTVLSVRDQGIEVGYDQRVEIDIGHGGAWRDRTCCFVRARAGRQARPQVDELADPLPGDPAHRSRQELAVIPDHLRDRRIERGQLRREFPVRGKVVLSAEPEVVHPGDVRHTGVEFLGHARIVPSPAGETS
jgi:hypothetical protein